MAHSQILFGEKSQLSTFWTAPLRLEIFGIFGQVDQYRRRRKRLAAQQTSCFFVFMVDVQMMLVGEHQQRQKEDESDNCQMTPDQFKKTVFLPNEFDVGNATILF